MVLAKKRSHTPSFCKSCGGKNPTRKQIIKRQFQKHIISGAHGLPCKPLRENDDNLHKENVISEQSFKEWKRIFQAENKVKATVASGTPRENIILRMWTGQENDCRGQKEEIWHQMSMKVFWDSGYKSPLCGLQSSSPAEMGRLRCLGDWGVFACFLQSWAFYPWPAHWATPLVPF